MAGQETDIFKYRRDVIDEITNFAKNADVESYEVNNKIEELKKTNKDMQSLIGDKKVNTWRDFIYGNESVESINSWKDFYFKFINIIGKEKRDEKSGIEKDDKQKVEEKLKYEKQETNNWKNLAEKNKEEAKKTKEKLERENEEKLKSDNKDEAHKKQYITMVECELANYDVSSEKLSKRLGVADWREKIWEADGFSAILNVAYDLKKIVYSRLCYEYVCGGCGTTKDEYTSYGWKGKKCCSSECQKDLKNKDNPPTPRGPEELPPPRNPDTPTPKPDKPDDSDRSPDRKPSDKGNTTIINQTIIINLGGFFDKLANRAEKVWFDFNTQKIMVSLKDGERQTFDSMSESKELPTDQKESLKNELKRIGKPVGVKELRSQNQPSQNPVGPSRKNNSGNIGLMLVIGAVVVVAFALIAVVATQRGRRRDY